jgi:hypothetical protein
MIITRTRLKSLLQMTATTYDTLIDMLIPMVEETICRYCNNDFLDRDFRFKNYLHKNTLSFISSTGKIRNTLLDNLSYDLISGDSIRIYDTAHNNQTFTIDSIDAEYITLNSIDTVNDESAGKFYCVHKVKYPIDLQLIASRMIQFGMKKIVPVFKSEKLDDYSYTNENDLILGYPKLLMSGLNQYRKPFYEEWGGIDV